MKLTIKLEPEDGSGGISFPVELSKKHFNIAKESTRLAASITRAIKNIQDELSKEE